MNQVITHNEKLASIIATLKLARDYKKQLYMGAWQRNFTKDDRRSEFVYETFDEFVRCGSCCCFAGYLAMDPLFIKMGGSMVDNGEPCFDDFRGSEAVEHYFGWCEYFSDIVCFTDTNLHDMSCDFYNVDSCDNVSFENLIDKLKEIMTGAIDPF